jgi:hypothetical protein
MIANSKKTMTAKERTRNIYCGIFLFAKNSLRFNTNKNTNANGTPIKIPSENERTKGTVTRTIIKTGLGILRNMIFK